MARPLGLAALCIFLLCAPAVADTPKIKATRGVGPDYFDLLRRIQELSDEQLYARARDDVDYEDLVTHPESHTETILQIEGKLLILRRIARKTPNDHLLGLYEAEIYNPQRNEKYFLDFDLEPRHFRPHQTVRFVGQFAKIHIETSRKGQPIAAPLLVGRRLTAADDPPESTNVARVALPEPTGLSEAVLQAALHGPRQDGQTQQPTTYFDQYLFPEAHRGQWVTAEGTIAQIRTARVGATDVWKVTVVTKGNMPTVAYQDRKPADVAPGDPVRAAGIFLACEAYTNPHDITLLAPAIAARTLEKITAAPTDGPEITPTVLWLAIAVALGILYLFLRRRAAAVKVPTQRNRKNP